MVSSKVFIAIALAFTASHAARAACSLERLASVDIEINPNGGVLVPVQMNGRDAWMVLNMGSGMPMIGPAAVEAFHLKTGPVAKESLINGNRVKMQAKADSVRIGNADFAGWTLLVVPGPARPLQGYRGRPMAGAFTSAFFNAVDLELDVGARKLNLFKQASCKGAQVYWGGEASSANLYSDDGGLLYFPLELDGKRVETSLNTQDRSSGISERVARDFYGFGIGSPGVASETRRGPDGAMITVGVKAMALTGRGLDIPALPITIEPERAKRCAPTTSRDSGGIGYKGCVGVVPLTIGTDVLSQLHLYIASKEQKIYFTRAASAVPGASAPPATGQAVPAGGAAVPAGVANAAGAGAAAPDAAAGQAPPAR
jgi:hypothetical protein